VNGTLAKTVLVVEDDLHVRKAVCDILEDAGYKWVCAANGREAIGLLQTKPKPNVILLDLSMPGMDGWSFRAWQQGNPEFAAIPIVILSATPTLSREAASLGAAAFLEKPVRLRALLDALARHA
jgi:CheY-like chemotaxis protein